MRETACDTDDVVTALDSRSTAAPTVVSLTLGVDGRLYCHDITPALLPVLSAVCGVDGQLERRQKSEVRSPKYPRPARRANF